MSVRTAEEGKQYLDGQGGEDEEKGENPLAFDEPSIVDDRTVEPEPPEKEDESEPDSGEDDIPEEFLSEASDVGNDSQGESDPTPVMEIESVSAVAPPVAEHVSDIIVDDRTVEPEPPEKEDESEPDGIISGEVKALSPGGNYTIYNHPRVRVDCQAALQVKVNQRNYDVNFKVQGGSIRVPHGSLMIGRLKLDSNHFMGCLSSEGWKSGPGGTDAPVVVRSWILKAPEGVEENSVREFTMGNEKFSFTVTDGCVVIKAQDFAIYQTLRAEEWSIADVLYR